MGRAVSKFISLFVLVKEGELFFEKKKLECLFKKSLCWMSFLCFGKVNQDYFEPCMLDSSLKDVFASCK
jgi:hypothetical protein